MKEKITIGLARMHEESNERRDFLPEFVAELNKCGARVYLEDGYGNGMGFREEEYKKLIPNVNFASSSEVYRQDLVLVLRYPSNERIAQIRSDACLISMIHFPTRPGRVAYLRSLGIEAISIDTITDDSGHRLVENLRAVGWNGVKIAFDVLRKTYPFPGFDSPDRPPVHVTLLGSGAVGVHAVQAAIRYGNLNTWQRMAKAGIPGVQLSVVDHDLSKHKDYMLDLLRETDILIDATQRPDTSQPVIPNPWIGQMPEHAVLLDLSVDPYLCDAQPISVKGIEGIPHGNLDKYIFAPDAKAYEEVPACIDTTHRRHAVSCYSWPGIDPKACMEHYGQQLLPLLCKIVEVGGTAYLDPEGDSFERALSRAKLSLWEIESIIDTP